MTGPKSSFVLALDKTLSQHPSNVGKFNRSAEILHLNADTRDRPGSETWVNLLLLGFSHCADEVVEKEKTIARRCIASEIIKPLVDLGDSRSEAMDSIGTGAIFTQIEQCARSFCCQPPRELTPAAIFAGNDEQSPLLAASRWLGLFLESLHFFNQEHWFSYRGTENEAWEL